MDNTKINENIDAMRTVVEHLTTVVEAQQKTIAALRERAAAGDDARLAAATYARPALNLTSDPVVNAIALRDTAVNRILEKGSMDKEAFLQVATLLSGEAAELAITERVIDRIEGMIPKLLALKAASVDPEVAELERRVRLQQLRKQLAPEPIKLVGHHNNNQ